MLDKGISISAAQIDNILAESAENLVPEYHDIGKAGVTTSNYISTDDTGSRHQGKNGFTNTLCNDFFTFFKTTDSKSRANFLEILGMQKDKSYTISNDAFAYAQKYGLSAGSYKWLISQACTTYTNQEFEKLLAVRLLSAKDKRVIIESCLYATSLANGLPKDLIILSDGAQQFNILTHALCWIHAERAIKKLVPVDDQEALQIKTILDLLWKYYDALRKYRLNPTQEQKDYLLKRFDEIFATPTNSSSLAPILKGFCDKKAELLLVLEYPEVPLQNNGAERSIRPFVTTRKISGGTRSDLGRTARDVFATIFQTCRKNRISVYAYLQDRIKNMGKISNLGQTIRLKNANPASP